MPASFSPRRRGERGGNAEKTDLNFSESLRLCVETRSPQDRPKGAESPINILRIPPRDLRALRASALNQEAHS
jgi:hypothetical protein